MVASGFVSLVGAGPGDPELLTVKAVKALEGADCVIYDRLVGPAILELAKPGAKRLFVGKEPGHHPLPQDDINALIAQEARAGQTVVRLKGGDPFIFGRGGEEALYLTRHGIPFEVIPGITAAAGCAAQAGIPLTHRGLATGVRFITGHHSEDGSLDLNWPALTDPDCTLVVYMGVGNMPVIAENLMHAGRAANTPVAAICQGTSPEQTIVTGCLENIVELIEAEGLKPPTLFIIGEVVNLTHTLRLAEVQDLLKPAADGTEKSRLPSAAV